MQTDEDSKKIWQVAFNITDEIDTALFLQVSGRSILLIFCRDVVGLSNADL
jgi:hypothetical protein